MKKIVWSNSSTWVRFIPFLILNIWNIQDPLRLPNDVLSGFRYLTLHARLRPLKKAVKDEVETSLIPYAILVYVSRGWQPCLAPREVILRRCDIKLGYPQALPRVPDLTAAAAILFSTLKLRDVILRHSHTYLT